MENKNIILILVAIVVILAVVMGVMFSQQMAKENSNLKITDKKINVGDSLVVVLADSQGNPIADETINIKLTDKDGIIIDEKITTNSKGKAKFKMEETGKYSMECKFDGNDKYKSTSIIDNITVKKATTHVVNEVSESSPSPDTITVELPEFGKTYTETAGDYSVDAQKWMGTTVGGFEVYLYKNGKSVDKDSYLSRAYFYMDGEWKWSEWDNGEEDHELRHRYPVSRGVEIQKVEVKF